MPTKKPRPRNEQTSPRIATLAGKGLRAWRAHQKRYGKTAGLAQCDVYNFAFGLTYGEIASCLASLATQTPDRKPLKTKRAKRKVTR